ncbi:hypothetical protein [Halobacteriovorax sp. HLS]|uniref:hypothetical protein n=1 Tax=Halobacteriovorax sp. HLS TaxID=2234000 RepID=UPI000FDAF3A9|nr:hypothetical protein [Halobacteriovorax sp. HLS]
MNISQTPDELYLLNTISRWRNLLNKDYSYEEAHSLHARDYISFLNPIFLSAFKNLSSINNFNFVQSRDGVIDLVKFFTKNPIPHGLLTKILINHRYRHIVPTAWINNIQFYEETFNTEGRSSKIKNFIYSSPFISTDIDISEIEKIRAESNIESLYICGDCSSLNLRFFHERISKIESIFNIKSSYIDAEQLQSFTLPNSILFEDKSSSLFYSKSYATWRLATNGIRPYNYSDSESGQIQETPNSFIKLITLDSLPKSNDKLYEWIRASAQKLSLDDLFADLENSNNFYMPVKPQIISLAQSIVENENLFYL